MTGYYDNLLLSNGIMDNVNDLIITLSLGLDFPCEVSFDEFQKGYKEEKKMISHVITINYTDKELYKKERGTMSIMTNFFDFQYIDYGNNKMGMDILEYLMYKICRGCLGGGTDLKSIKRMRDLLKGDIVESFSYKQFGGKAAISVLKKDFDRKYRGSFEFFSGFVKYYSAKNLWWIKEEYKEAYKSVLATPQTHGIGRGFVKMLQKVHYKQTIEENEKLQYLIYCVLFLQKELYLVFYEGLYPEKVGIVDKDGLDWYLKRGVLAIDLSDLVFSLYLDLYKDTKIFEAIKTKRDKQKAWESLLKDLKATSKNKKKLVVNIDVADDIPHFMSTKRTVSDVNLYKQVEEEIGEHGEITRVISRGKRNALKVKKRFIYDEKDGKKHHKK